MANKNEAESIPISKPKIIKVKTLDLVLDLENPRILKPVTNQNDIREYLLKHENVSELAQRINNMGILPGDVLVVIKNGEKYIVMEGNRRTAAMQMMLNPSLIPAGQKGIPEIDSDIRGMIEEQDAHLVESRGVAERIMAIRHIDGVKSWKTLAKQNFFYSRFEKGSSIQQLSNQTGIKASDIRKHVRKYKFFMDTFEDYKKINPEISLDITKIEVEPFVRPFTVNTDYDGVEISAADLLEVTYDDKEGAVSGLGNEVFRGICLHVFNEFISGRVNTRMTLTQISGVKELIDVAKGRQPDGEGPGGGPGQGGAGGSSGGGPGQGRFFEDINWKDRLNSKDKNEVDLLVVLKELHTMSSKHIGKKPAFEIFPIAAAVLMRCAYEQAMWLLLKRTKLIKVFMDEYNPNGTKRIFPLSELDEFVSKKKDTELSITTEIRKQYSAIQRNQHRDILNDIVHSPGKIKPTPEAVESLCKGGLLYFIQEVIDLK